MRKYTTLDYNFSRVSHISRCTIVTDNILAYGKEINSCSDGRPCQSKVGREVGRFQWGELSPHLTQCPWAEAYLRTKWHLDPSSRLATEYMGRGLYGRRRRQACVRKL